jgi:pimeloyl-ACP methyl ester carboxylesterase
MSRRMVLFPGLGADERMFVRIGNPGFPLQTPRLPVPKPGEDLSRYARRTADLLDLDENAILGGSSFGSLVASAISRQKRIRGLVLIGGALSSEGLRPIPGVGILRNFPDRMLRPMIRSDRALEFVFGAESAELRELARQMMADAPDSLLLRGGRMILDYHPAAPPFCPVFAIHGAKDVVMSPPPVPGCRILSEGGHGIAWTHPSEVCSLLQEVWTGCGH